MECSMTEVAQAIATLNLSVWQEELKEFVRVYDKNSEVFAAAILEDVEEFLKTMKMVEENLDKDNDIFISQRVRFGSRKHRRT